MTDLQDVVPLDLGGTAGTTRTGLKEAAAEAVEGSADDKWERQPNRSDLRDIIHMRGAIKPQRSRIRRRIHRLARKHGKWL